MANLMGRGGTAAPFPTSETVGTSVADPKVGKHFWDNSDNEYVVVDCQQAFVPGEFVLIDSAHLATRLNDAYGNARVGVIVSTVTSSDTKAYAQIYGLYEGAAGTSNVASSKILGIPAGSSDLGYVTGFATSDEDSVIIYGAYPVTATDSATSSPPSSFVSAGSSATVAIGFSVWLNYPYVINKAQLTGTIGDT